MLKLLPTEERARHTCAVCGDPLVPVKYLADLYDENDQVVGEAYMCNKCALALALEPVETSKKVKATKAE